MSVPALAIHKIMFILYEGYANRKPIQGFVSAFETTKLKSLWSPCVDASLLGGWETQPTAITTNPPHILDGSFHFCDFNL